MSKNKDRISLVVISLLSLTLGSTLAAIGPVQGQFAATIELVWFLPGPDGLCSTSDDEFVGSNIPALPAGSIICGYLRILDAFDMDSWDVILNYYTKVLTAIDARYTTCGDYQLFRDPSLIDDIGDGIRGQIGLGASYAVVPTKGFTGSCVLAEIDFVVDTGADVMNLSTKIHITRFSANSIIGTFPSIEVVPMPIGFRNDASYGSSSARYVDLLDSPIRKRCTIENNSPWSISRDGADGILSFDCKLFAFGNAYPVVARVSVTIIDHTTNAALPPLYSNEAQFFSAGQMATVRIVKGTLSDDNNDGIIDLQPGHLYQVNAQALYDCTGTTFDDCAGVKNRVFSFTVKA